MNPKKILTIILVLGLAIGAKGLLYPNNAGAFSGITINAARLEFVETDAEIMVVNIKKSYLIVAEIKFDVTEFKIGEKIYKTALVDADGETATLKSFKKGQRVIVKSIKLPNGDLIAGFIQIKAPGYKIPKKYRFIPKAPSIKPAK